MLSCARALRQYFANAVLAHTTRMTLAVPLVSVCIAGGLMAAAPWILLKFDMSAGVFLAVLTATQQMGAEADALFNALLQIQLSISALLKVYALMNMPTDIKERMLANRKQRQRGRTVVEDATVQQASSGDAPLLRTLGLAPRGASHGAEPSGRPSGGMPKCARMSTVCGRRGSSRATQQIEADTMLIELLSVGFNESGQQALSAGSMAVQMYRRKSLELSPLPDVSQRTSEDSCISHFVRSQQQKQQQLPAQRRHQPPSPLSPDTPASGCRLTDNLHPDLQVQAQGGHGRSTGCGGGGGHGGGRRRQALVPSSSPLQDVSIQLRQGRVYALVGPHASGKAQLLRLIGKAAYPTRGEVFVPPHLSVVHVEEAPMLFGHLNLYDNLTFGYKRGQPRPSVQHCAEVCEMLGLSEKWLSFLKETARAAASAKLSHTFHKARLRAQNAAGTKLGFIAASRAAAKLVRGGACYDAEDMMRPADVDKALDAPDHADDDETESDADWEGRLSSSDRHILHIARAFITNAHVMCIHRPFSSLDVDLRIRLLHTFRAFIDQRGEVRSGHPRGLLARTIIFSCSLNEESAIEMADAVIVVGLPEGGASVLEASQLENGGTDGRETRVGALQRLANQANAPAWRARTTSIARTSARSTTSGLSHQSSETAVRGSRVPFGASANGGRSFVTSLTDSGIGSTAASATDETTSAGNGTGVVHGTGAPVILAGLHQGRQHSLRNGAQGSSGRDTPNQPSVLPSPSRLPSPSSPASEQQLTDRPGRALDADVRGHRSHRLPNLGLQGLLGLHGSHSIPHTSERSGSDARRQGRSRFFAGNNAGA